MTVTGGRVRVRILGPLELRRDDVVLDPGPRQQACLLALLAARDGRPVSITDLIDLMWGDDAPASALNVIHKYVGSLRHLMEPGLPVRESGSYLLRHGNGYLLATDPGSLDLAAFRQLVDAAAAAAKRDREVALDHHVAALGLWTGPVADGLEYTPSASSIFAVLHGEFFGSCVAAAELAMSLGRPQSVVAPLRLAATMAPFHEPVLAALISVLGAAGQPAEALELFRVARDRLADELGIDPGPALLEAQQSVVRPSTGPSGPALSRGPAPQRLVGRVEELSMLLQAVAPALTGGTGLVLVEGEPGAGKSHLLDEAAASMERRGVFIIRAWCLPGEGTPSMWPWTQIVGEVLAAHPELPVGELGRLVAPADAPAAPDTRARFRLFEEVIALIGAASARRPLLLVIDDLHWADVASLEALGRLAVSLPDGTAVLGALRDRAPMPGPELSRMLAAASRVPGQRRLRLRPLDVTDVAELIRREVGQDPGPAVVRDIHARTAGNPFFVRELSRLLADSDVLTDAATIHGRVPATVRDVVRDRMAGLDDGARDLLQTAAVVGREVDLGLLARAAGAEIRAVLARLEPLQGLGLIDPAPGDPYTFRFGHDLVRESVAEIIPRPRIPLLHLRIADAIRPTDPDGEADTERLAYHLWAAGPLADPARTGQALISAGRCATAKTALRAAERHLRSAVQVTRSAGLAELELSALSQLSMIMGMRSGYVEPVFAVLERAERISRDLGREREATDFLFAQLVGTNHVLRLDRSGQIARRMLDRAEKSSDPLVRAYGFQGWGTYQWNLGNIGDALRYLTRCDEAVLDDLTRGEEAPLRHDLQVLWPATLALVTALHGEIDAARQRLGSLEPTAAADPYGLTVWSMLTGMVAAMAGDPTWARHAAGRALALPPEQSSLHLERYIRLIWCWARAVSGDDPAGAVAQSRELILLTLEPPRAGAALFSGLYAETLLVAGLTDEAGTALDRADAFLDTYGQRYPEGLLLLLRARLLRAAGRPAPVVRATAEQARDLSRAHEAHLFARRAKQFLAEI